MSGIKNVRIMWHDCQADIIRMGPAFPIVNREKEIEAVEKATRVAYEYKHEEIGRFDKSCKEFYKRVAIVDAETLEVIRLIYPKDGKN